MVSGPPLYGTLMNAFSGTRLAHTHNVGSNYLYKYFLGMIIGDGPIRREVYVLESQLSFLYFYWRPFKNETVFTTSLMVINSVTWLRGPESI